MKLVLLLSLFYKRRKLRLREVIISSYRCGYKCIFSERQQKPSSTKLPYSVPFLQKGAGIQVRDNYLTILSSLGSFSLWGERRKGWRPPPPTPLWIWVSCPRNRGFALGQRRGHFRRRCLRLCLGCPADRKPLASPRMLRLAGDNSAGFARFRLPGGAKT